jgi:hypothetical protein
MHYGCDDEASLRLRTTQQACLPTKRQGLATNAWCRKELTQVIGYTRPICHDPSDDAGHELEACFLQAVRGSIEKREHRDNCKTPDIT